MGEIDNLRSEVARLSREVQSLKQNSKRTLCKRCKGNGKQPGLHNLCGRCGGSGYES